MQCNIYRAHTFLPREDILVNPRKVKARDWSPRRPISTRIANTFSCRHKLADFRPDGIHSEMISLLSDIAAMGCSSVGHGLQIDERVKV